MSSPRGKALTVLAIGGIAAGMFALPMYFVKSRTGGPLQTQEKGLSGSQVMRGPYLNTGTKDVGSVDAENFFSGRRRQ